MSGINDRFTRLADHVSESLGRWWVMALSLLGLLVWAAWGPLAHFSDTWQLVANTFTTLGEWFIGLLVAAAANRSERRIRQILEADAARTALMQAILEELRRQGESLVSEQADMAEDLKDLSESLRDGFGD